MEHARLLYSFFIGLAIFAFVFTVFAQSFEDPHVRNVCLATSIAVGGLSGVWYYGHPREIETFVNRVVGPTTGLVLAMIAGVLVFWKMRSLFG